jgi:hypothetical protein
MGVRLSWLRLPIALAMVASAREARADAPQPAGTEVQRTPSGFYLRFASGFAAFDEHMGADAAAAGESRGRNRGLATLGELALGGTVAPGWVIGGGIYAADLLASTYRSQTAAPPPELDPGLRNVALIAPFMDHAFASLPGVHLQLALGLATLTPRVLGDVATTQSKYLALGAGLMIGTGYEWPVSESWRLGVLARTTLSVLGGDDDSGASWVHVVVTSPGVLFSLTYQ